MLGMKKPLTCMAILIAIAAPSYGAERQMTRGLSNQRADGTPGINYQGGVAGYTGAVQDADSIGMDVTPPEQVKANAEAESARLKADAERERAVAKDRQQAIQRQQAALRAQREAERLQAQQKRTSNLRTMQQAPARQQENPRDLYGGQTKPGDLNMACGSKGFGADYVTGNCVSPRGQQTNPQNLYPPFGSPLPKPQPGSLMMRCGAMGRSADFVTGRCN
jgi:hypothetical protein